ncbi:MAG: chemotaxis protein CheW [Candidatus Eiseniibacteriota bacterium]|nr:MAG: chemotaxis protein CheW [Candidatus Eisenbacteria bacterium]
MMASQAVHEELQVEGPPVHHNAKVEWRHRGILVSLGAHAVCGCTEVAKLCRIPGSQEGVKGIVSFKGGVVPVLSLLCDSPARSRRKARGDNFVVVLSLDGVTFALEVNEIPCVVSGTARPEKPRGKLCTVHRRHLQRLLRSRLVEGGFGQRNGREKGSEEKSRSARGADASTPIVGGARPRAEGEAVLAQKDGR